MSKNKGIIVTLAGLGVNLILGVLYAWSIISAALIDRLGWTATMTQIPYMVACIVFALSMVPGGRLQDRLGPKAIILTSGVLAGIGFFLAGTFLTLFGLTIFYGLVFGLSMGLGYAAPTPAAVKWFGPGKRGLISGIVVSGFGLAPIYIAPLTTHLISTYGIRDTFFILGASFSVVIIGLAQLISNPPKGYVPPGEDQGTVPRAVQTARLEMDWHQVLRTRQFYLLWTMFCFGTFAGLLLIGQLAKIGLEQAGIRTPYTLIAVYAFFNFSGRIGCGVISDRLGRMKTLLLMFALQLVVYSAFSRLVTPLSLMAGIAVVGFTFGGMLTIFPATTADFFGLKNFGVNYGLLITAWGVGGFLGPLLGGMVRDVTGTYTLSYTISAIVSALGILLTLITKTPAQEALKVAAPPAPALETSE